VVYYRWSGMELVKCYLAVRQKKYLVENGKNEIFIKRRGGYRGMGLLIKLILKIQDQKGKETQARNK